jgi:hypothetical protein
MMTQSRVLAALWVAVLLSACRTTGRPGTVESVATTTKSVCFNVVFHEGHEDYALINASGICFRSEGRFVHVTFHEGPLLLSSHRTESLLASATCEFCQYLQAADEQFVFRPLAESKPGTFELIVIEPRGSRRRFVLMREGPATYAAFGMP